MRHPLREASAALVLVVTLGGCGAAARAAPPELAGTTTDARPRDIEAVLDAWHAAAARSDEDAYFALLTEDSVFLGTDATERWGRDAFRAYAHAPFEAGRGWVFRAVRRDVTIDPGGRLAWFDEDLETEGLGPARGSGVLRRGDDGAWRIVQYNLALTIPNERFSDVRRLLSDPAPPPETPAQ